MVDYVCEDFLPDILASKIPGSSICCSSDEWFTEDMAGEEKAMEPLAPGRVGHDSFDIVDAFAFGEPGCLFGSTDVFSV